MVSRSDEGIPTATTRGEIPTTLPLAPPLDAWHVRRLVRRSHTLVNARRIKMSGTRAADLHQRRRRNAELLEIQIHDRWTRVEVQQTQSEEIKNSLYDRQRKLGEPDECGGQDEDGDLRPILHGSFGNEGDWQGRPFHKLSWSAYSRPAVQGRQIDRFWPDHHCTETTGMQERHLRDDAVVGALCHLQRQVHHYREHRHSDSCNLPGIRVPKRARW